MMHRTRIFLAHASEDKPQVRRLYGDLKSRGFNPWLDEIDLVPGQIWKEEIPRAIREAGAFVACLSTASVEKRGYVQSEFKTALAAFADLPPRSIYLIPLKLDECDIPDLQIPDRGLSLRDIHWLELWRDDGFDRLVRAIQLALGAGTRAVERSRDIKETGTPDTNVAGSVAAAGVIDDTTSGLGKAPTNDPRALWERRRASSWRKFERDYSEAILDRWNKLELFGIDVSADVQRKQKLSVAYIQLNLQGAEAKDSSTGSGTLASFEETLAMASDSGQPLVILGEAGGGKTTVLRWAACEAVTRQLECDALNPFTSPLGERFEAGWPDCRQLEDQPKLAWWARVPFLLRLREVKDGGLPKEHDWPAKSAALPRDSPPDWLDEILGGGHGLILLDGLDELGSVGRDLARDTLRSILRDRRGNLVVLTSRPGAFEPDWFEDVPLQLTTIRAMSPAQRQACITN